MNVRLFFTSVVLLVELAALNALAQQPPETVPSTSDRDKAGLRGPVKKVEYFDSHSGADNQEWLTTNTTEYTPDGRRLKEEGGNSDGNNFIVRYTYGADGRLVNIVSGYARSSSTQKMTYLYDKENRLSAVNSGDGASLSYRY